MKGNNKSAYLQRMIVQSSVRTTCQLAESVATEKTIYPTYYDDPANQMFSGHAVFGSIQHFFRLSDDGRGAASTTGFH